MSKKHLVLIAVFTSIILTAVVFLPSLSNKFVDSWDDREYVLENNIITSLSPGNLNAIFTKPFAASYCPLAIISYSLEYRFFKLNPFIYHLTNYIFHILTTLLVFLFIYSISGNLIIAFLTTLLFGLHPTHVESVAWVSERKDVLCAFFYISALVFYQRYRKSGKAYHYALCFLSALLSLLSKGMAVTIPFILLLMDYLLGRRMTLKVIFEKIPIFLLSLIFAVVNFYCQSSGGAMAVGGDIWFRLYFFSKAIPHYLFKIVAPLNLSAIYPYHNISMHDLREVYYNMALMAALLVIMVFSRRRTKKIIFGISFFLITVLPVLKIVPLGDAFAADRYLYLPSIGIFYLFSAVFAYLFSKKSISGLGRSLLIGLIAAYIGYISISTWARCYVWRDTESLFLDVSKHHIDIPLVNNALGGIYANKGEFSKAIRYFKKAAFQRSHPQYRAKAERNLALAYTEAKKEAVAPPPFISTDDLKDAVVFNKLGIIRLTIQDWDDAVELFREAVEINPRSAEAYNNLGYAYYRKGDRARAMECFEKALEIEPNYAGARSNSDAIKKMQSKGASH